MSLKIFVNHPPDVPLQTNRLVDGYVEAHYKKAEQKDALQQIVLKFYGRSKVHIMRDQQSYNGTSSTTHTTHYHSKALLFVHYHRLNNPQWAPPASRRGEDGGILTYPFSFRIPTYAEPQDPQTTDAHRAHVFNHREHFPGSVGYDPPTQEPPPIPLPDTVYEVSVRLDSSIRAEASVRYTLNAECPQLKAGASSFWMGNVNESVDLDIINPATLPPQNIQWVRLGFEDIIRSYDLLPADNRPKLGFRDRMSAVFKKDRLPWWACCMTLQLPDTLWVDRPAEEPLPLTLNIRPIASDAGESMRRKSDVDGERPPISLSFEKSSPFLDHERSTAYPSPRPEAELQDPTIPTPRMTLTSLTMKLNYYMAVRGADASTTSYGGRTYELGDNVTFFEWRASKKSPQVEIPVGDDAWLDIGQQLGISYGHLKEAANYSGFGGLQGEFRTPNLSRSFGIEWIMKFEGVEEEIKWESRAKYGGGLPLRFLRGDIAPNPNNTLTQQNQLSPPSPIPHRGSTPVDPRRSYPSSPQMQPASLSPNKPLPGPPVPAKEWPQQMPPPAYSPYAVDGPAGTSQAASQRQSWGGSGASGAEGMSEKMANLHVQDPDSGPSASHRRASSGGGTGGDWGSNNPYVGQLSSGEAAGGSGAGNGQYRGGGGGDVSWEKGKY